MAHAEVDECERLTYSSDVVLADRAYSERVYKCECAVRERVRDAASESNVCIPLFSTLRFLINIPPFGHTSRM